jgi:hypothetical protein
MKIVWLKHLLVFICIFSILESTGVSLSSLLKKTTISQNDYSSLNDDEDAAQRNENKETNLKEFWVIQQNLLLPQLNLCGIAVDYPNEKSSHHLAWISPVPTPPPNNKV